MLTTAGLSPRLRDCLTAIRAYTRVHGVSPTYEQIAGLLGVGSKSNVYRRIVALEERGYVTRIPGKKCSVAVIDHGALDLPTKLRARLVAYCRGHGERVADVLADAVTLFLDGAARDPGCRSELTSTERERTL